MFFVHLSEYDANNTRVMGSVLVWDSVVLVGPLQLRTVYESVKKSHGTFKI